jgi:hypothetical protein
MLSYRLIEPHEVDLIHSCSGRDIYHFYGSLRKLYAFHHWDYLGYSWTDAS